MAKVTGPPNHSPSSPAALPTLADNKQAYILEALERWPMHAGQPCSYPI